MPNLGKPACRDRRNQGGRPISGRVCAIPEESELPESGVTGILLNKEAARVAVDGTITPDSKSSPSNATNQAVTWSSSDPTIATVDENGTITGVATGIVDITVTSGRTRPSANPARSQWWM